MTDRGQCASDPACESKVHSRGMCLDHYMLWYRANPDKVRRYLPRDMPPLEKLMAKVKKDRKTGCWNKIGWKADAGYGQIWLNGRYELMHRLAYELFICPIPEGFDVDHMCENSSCCFHGHLEHVPHRINTLRGYGHPAQDHLLRSGCLCPVRSADTCPIHGQLHWRPDWRERREAIAQGAGASESAVLRQLAKVVSRG